MLTAIYYFEVSNLWVSGELLDARHTFTFANNAITLVLPSDSTDFRSVTGSFSPLGYTKRNDDGDISFAEIRIMSVEIQIERDWKAPGPIKLPQSDEQLRQIAEGLNILNEAVGIAEEFAQRYIALVRTQQDQFWLGPSESKLRASTSRMLVDSDGNEMLLGYNEPVTVTMHPDDSALSKELHTTLLQKASEAADPELAATFITDAEYMAFNVVPPNLRQAVLLAAIACELKIKEVITTLASPEQGQLVNLLLENPRDWTMAAASLFDKGLEAICGKSLRKENRSLFKEIDLLFRDRNSIAHRGESRSSNEILEKHIISAKAAFEWLDRILSGTIN